MEVIVVECGSPMTSRRRKEKMNVKERNKLIAECVKELSLSYAAFLEQTAIITKKYDKISNIANGIQKAFVGSNDLTKIGDCIVECQTIHDTYFPRGKPLDDKQWEKLVKEMDALADKYKNDIPEFVGGICMAFLDDIEEYHKKWTEYLNGKS